MIFSLKNEFSIWKNRTYLLNGEGQFKMSSLKLVEGSAGFFELTEEKKLCQYNETLQDCLGNKFEEKSECLHSWFGIFAEIEKIKDDERSSTEGPGIWVRSAAYKKGWEKEVEFPQQIVGAYMTINLWIHFWAALTIV